MPASAKSKRALDLDGDGKADTIFIDGTTGFGVATATGAVITADPLLAGGGDRHAWAMTMDSEPPVAVVDDGHTTGVFALVDCALVRPKDPQGTRYTFTLDGFGPYSTGVTCAGSPRGDYTLAGVDAVKVRDGRFRIDTTPVSISKDGKTATNRVEVRGTKTFAAGSSEVQQAKESICPQVPRLTDAGR